MIVPVAVNVKGETDAVVIVNKKGIDEINRSIKMNVSCIEMRSTKMIVSSIEMICLKILSINSLTIVTISKFWNWLTKMQNESNSMKYNLTVVFDVEMTDWTTDWMID